MIVDVLALRAPTAEIDVLVRDVRRLGVMLDDLCELTRASAGRLAFATRALDLAKVVSHVVDAIGPQLGQLGAALAVTIPDGVRVIADPTWLPVALASILRHIAAPSARLELVARRAAGRIHCTVRATPRAASTARALDFARRLVELQGGRVTAGPAVRVSLPAAP